MKTKVAPPLIGWRELVSLPALKLASLKAKVDTGARSSSLDAEDTTIFKLGRTQYVRFSVPFEHTGASQRVVCESPLVDERWITSSDGRRELRPVIQTEVQMGGEIWPIEVSLTSRAVMGFRMLLGREAIRGRFVVDPSRSFLLKIVKKKPAKKAARGAKVLIK